MAPSSVSKCVRQNNISVMVLGFEESNFFPMDISTLREEARHEVDLLYLKRGDKSHWCLITDLEQAFISNQMQGAQSSVVQVLPAWFH